MLFCKSSSASHASSNLYCIDFIHANDGSNQAQGRAHTPTSHNRPVQPALPLAKVDPRRRARAGLCHDGVAAQGARGPAHACDRRLRPARAAAAAHRSSGAAAPAAGAQDCRAAAAERAARAARQAGALGGGGAVLGGLSGEAGQGVPGAAARGEAEGGGGGRGGAVGVLTCEYAIAWWSSMAWQVSSAVWWRRQM